MKAHGIIVALHTPLTPAGEVHEEALRTHLEWMVRSGIHGIFPCGTMGEGIALSDVERRRVTEICVDQVRGRIPVMPQVTTNNTAGCIDLARHARETGCDAISVIAP
jgi:4-hydroxy-tetrahydrodipicolinate synthase